MNNKILNDNDNDSDKIKYQIIVNNTVLAERGSVPLAEAFISQLTTEQQNIANIVPITGGGQQVLFG